MKNFIPTFNDFVNESIDESKNDDYVSATLTKDHGTIKKGQVVKVNALEYTTRGNKDKVTIINPAGKKVDIQKEFLSVKI